jgi:Ca2+-binding RTX toxin-like protein
MAAFVQSLLCVSESQVWGTANAYCGPVTFGDVLGIPHATGNFTYQVVTWQTQTTVNQLPATYWTYGGVGDYFVAGNYGGVGNDFVAGNYGYSVAGNCVLGGFVPDPEQLAAVAEAAEAQKLADKRAKELLE